MVRFLPILSAAAALAACSAAPAAESRTQPKSSTTVAHPVVVELFQSQGCASCPPANAAVNAIAGRPDVLALSFAVTYWDRLGWKDVSPIRPTPAASGSMRAPRAAPTSPRRR